MADPGRHYCKRSAPNGTVPRKAKWFASIMMLISGILMLLTSAPLGVKIFTDVTMLIVAIWLWLRPEPLAKADEVEQ